MFEKFLRLGKESIIYGLGGLTSRFVGFLLLPIFTRIFSPFDFGVMDIIVTMTALAAIVLTAGADSATSYYFFKYESMDDRRKTAVTSFVQLLIINGAMAGIVWLLAGEIAGLAFDDRDFSVYLRVAIIAIPFTSLATANLNLLRLQRRPWAYVTISISRLLFSVVLNIILVVYLKVGIIGVFWTNVITSVMASAVGLAANHRLIGFSFDWTRLKQLLRYGLPLIIGGLSVWIINYLDRYFLLQYDSLEQIGVYSVAVRLASVVIIATTAFRLANLAFLYESMDDENARQIYSRTLSYFVLVTSLICVPLSLFARPTLMVMATPSYVEAYKVVPFLAYSAVGYGLYQIVGAGLLVTKRTGLAGLTTASGAVFTVLFLVLLVPPLGILGAAIATMMTHVGVITLKYIVSQRVYPVPYDLSRVVRTLGAAASVIGLNLLFQPSGFWASCLLGAILFLAFLAMIPLLSLIEPREVQIALMALRGSAVGSGTKKHIL